MSRAPGGSPIVLHVLEALEGGTARHLVDVVRHTPGVAHHVATPSERVGWVTDASAFAAFNEAGAEVHLLGMRRRPLSPRNALALAALTRLVASLRPAIVHGHSAAGGALARLTPRIGRPAVVYTPNGLAQGRLAHAVERALGPRTDRLVAVSASEGELVLARRLVEPGRLSVVPNGVDLTAPPPACDLRQHLGIAAGTPLVGTVARLVPQKSPLDFVAAAAVVAEQRPDVHVALVGSGPLRAEVVAAVRAAGLDDRFHLVAGIEQVGSVLGQLDVFVLASAFEGGPYSPLEAMRGGAPVVLTDVVGNRDVVEDGVSGRLVPPGDPAALAGAVLALLDDPATAGRLTAAARQRVAERFDVRQMGEALGRVYVALLDRRAAARRTGLARPPS